MRVMYEDEFFHRYNVVIHMPMYDDPDEDWQDSIAYTTIQVSARSEEDARAEGVRYIRVKQRSTARQYWINAEVVAVSEVEDSYEDQ